MKLIKRPVAYLVALTASFVSLMGGAHAADPWDLDTTFSGDGFAVSTFLSHDIAIQNDGKILIAGRAGSPGTQEGLFALTRLEGNGSVDTAFGGNGTVLTDFLTQGGPFVPEDSAVYGLKIQPDGKILAAGTVHKLDGSTWTEWHIGLARYESDGSLDGGFGDGGRVLSEDIRQEGFDLDLQSDGKILVVGHQILAVGQSDEFFLKRYTPDGAPDGSAFDGEMEFPPAGTTVTDPLDSRAVLVVPGDKVLVAGSSYPNTGFVVLGRFQSDGSPDSAFGTGGSVVTAEFGVQVSNRIPPHVRALAMQSDGRILVGGYFADETAGGGLFLMKFKPDGTIDSSFGTNGTVIRKISDTENFLNDFDMAIQTDDKIVAVATQAAATEGLVDAARYAVLRFLPNGEPDPAFGGDGMAVIGEDTPPIPASDFITATAVALQSDGRIVIDGTGGAVRLVGSTPAAPPSVVCGNGLEQGAEECDDGNVSDGDGCSAACQSESGGTSGDGDGGGGGGGGCSLVPNFS